MGCIIMSTTTVGCVDETDIGTVQLTSKRGRPSSMTFVLHPKLESQPHFCVFRANSKEHGKEGTQGNVTYTILHLCVQQVSVLNSR